MKDCICDTKKRWLFYHLEHCPWRKQVEYEEYQRLAKKYGPVYS